MAVEVGTGVKRRRVTIDEGNVTTESFIETYPNMDVIRTPHELRNIYISFVDRYTSALNTCANPHSRR